MIALVVTLTRSNNSNAMDALWTIWAMTQSILCLLLNIAIKADYGGFDDLASVCDKTKVEQAQSILLAMSNSPGK